MDLSSRSEDPDGSHQYPLLDWVVQYDVSIQHTCCTTALLACLPQKPVTDVVHHTCITGEEILTTLWHGINIHRLVEVSDQSLD